MKKIIFVTLSAALTCPQNAMSAEQKIRRKKKRLSLEFEWRKQEQN